mgnify:FL=1
MCERILRNSSFDHKDAILRDCQELFTEPGLSSGADPVLFRSLTSGELKLAQSLFKNIINYDRVKIYCDHNHSRYQSKVITNTRNGEILLSINEYQSDFSANYTDYHDSVKYPHLFIFAMSFVWQYYRHDSSFHDNTYESTHWDSYDLEEPHFIFYSMEQQAAMIADYWLLKKHDLMEYEKLSSYKKHEQFNFNKRKELLDKYESILWMHIQVA